MKTVILYAIILTSTFLASAQEKQVAIDSRGNVMFIDKDNCSKLNLFSEYSDLSAVRLFLLEDSTFALEVFYFKRDSLFKDRTILTVQQVNKLRTKVDNEIAMLKENAPLNQKGRSRLLIGSSLASASYYSWAVPAVLNVEEDKVFIGLTMLSTGGSIYGAFALTKNRRVTMGDAYMSWYGQSRGIFSGLLTPWLFTNNANERLHIGFGIVESVGFAIGGYHWADKTNMHIGKALTIGTYCDFSSLIGIATSYSVGFFDYDEALGLAWGTLVGAASGICAGNYLSNKIHYSSGDAYMLKGATVLGAAVPATVLLLFDSENDRLYTGTIAMGGIGGFVLGHHIANRVNYSAEQGIYICLSEIGGGLIGLGTGYLLFSDFDDGYKPIAISALLGGTAGFFSMKRYLDGRNEDEKKESAFKCNVNLNSIVNVVAHRLDNSMWNERKQMPLFSASLRL